MAQGTQNLTSYKANKLTGINAYQEDNGMLTVIVRDDDATPCIKLKDARTDLTRTNDTQINMQQGIHIVDQNDVAIAKIFSIAMEDMTTDLYLNVHGQSGNDDLGYRGLHIAYNADGTSQSVFSTKLIISDDTPATSFLSASIRTNGGISASESVLATFFNVGNHVNLEWNDTDKSLDFIFI